MSPPNRRAFLKLAAFASVAGSARPSDLLSYAPLTPTGKVAHPHLFYHKEDVERLRTNIHKGQHAVIWKNMRDSAEEYLNHQPPTAIPHGRADIPNHDLYVTFYHSMFTMAMLQHFTFCYVLSEDKRYLKHARAWMIALLGWERTWGTPYEYSRYLLGASVYYDCLFEELAESEQGQIREMLNSQMVKYAEDVLVPRQENTSFSTHHATIYYCGGGVAACALLGEVPEAQHWLDLVKHKYETTILPFGFSIDGGHQEGMTFWASQNQYRFFFLDALKNTTGDDYYRKFQYEVSLPVNWGIYSYMGGEVPAKALYETDEFVSFSADYGQLDYSSPALLRFASAFRHSYAQWVALKDPNMGKIQTTATSVVGYPEKLLFCLGPFAYLWYDESVKPEKLSALPLARRFRGSEQVMMRNSWEDDQLFFGIEGRAPGSQGALDFIIHYKGQTLAAYQQLESKSPLMNHLAPNTIEFQGEDQLDASVPEFFSTPAYSYARADAQRFQRHIIFLQPHYIVMFDAINVLDAPTDKIRWELHSMGNIEVAGSGQVSVSRGRARLRLQTLLPQTANYEILKEHMFRTVGNGAVKVTTDANEYPHLLLPLEKQDPKEKVPSPPCFLNIFYPEGEIESSQVTGGLQNETAFLRLDDSKRQDLLLWRMGRVAFAEGVYTDGDNCLIQRSGDQLTGYGIYNGSVLLDGKGSLFRARDLFTLGVRYERDKVIASFKANSGGEIAIYCPGKPVQVIVNGLVAKFNYVDGEKFLRVAIPAGEGALQVHC
jgi:hypothetical protein